MDEITKRIAEGIKSKTDKRMRYLNDDILDIEEKGNYYKNKYKAEKEKAVATLENFKEIDNVVKDINQEIKDYEILYSEPLYQIHNHQTYYENGKPIVAEIFLNVLDKRGNDIFNHKVRQDNVIDRNYHTEFLYINDSLRKYVFGWLHNN